MKIIYRQIKVKRVQENQRYDNQQHRYAPVGSLLNIIQNFLFLEIQFQDTPMVTEVKILSSVALRSILLN